MSTIFFIGQNPSTGCQTLYSVTAGTLGSIMDSFSPDKDIVEQIWQKRYVFLTSTYFDSMKDTAQEKTDSTVVPRATSDKSVVKCKNLKNDDVKIRFVRNNISQYKRESDISLLLKIEECASEFTLFAQSEQIQLVPSARHIQELFKTDGEINIYKANDVVSTSTGGNIVAWRVGSYNDHSIITLENSPDAQKYVLVSEDVIVGVVETVPAEFDRNAVAVNAQLTVGDANKNCLVRGEDNVHAPLEAHTTHEVIRQWKNYLELSLSNNSGTVVVTIDGCHVEYNVYDAKPLQYIELTQRVEIEGSISSIGSRWKVESMDENGIVPEINIFTPDVKETITNYDAFIFVNDNPCIALRDTTITVTQSVMLRPSYSLENNEGRSFGKLPIGSVHTADMVVYDRSGRAWFHITSDEPLELEQSEGVSTRRGWVNGKASDGNYIFADIEPTVVDDRNVRVKECTYITVKQDLGPIEGSALDGNAYVMTHLQALTVEDGEPHNLSYGDKVQLVRLFTTKFQFTHNGILCELSTGCFGVDVRREAEGIFTQFVADDNMLSFDGNCLCMIRGESLHNVVAFVEDDYIDSTDDVIFGEILSGDSHVFKIVGEGTHGSYRYVELREGDEEEGSTYIAKYSEILVPTRYELAEGDKLKNFTPNDISLKRTPFSGASESEFVPAGTTLDLSSAFGVTLGTNWGIGVDSDKFTNAVLYEKSYDLTLGVHAWVFGTESPYIPCTPYKNGDLVETWVGTSSVASINADGNFDGTGGIQLVLKSQDSCDITEDGVLCSISNGTESSFARIPLGNIYFNNGGFRDRDYILIGDSVEGFHSWNGEAETFAENTVFQGSASCIKVEDGDTINYSAPSLTHYGLRTGDNYLIPLHPSAVCIFAPSIVLMHKYADITESEFGDYIEEQDLGDNSFEVSMDPCSGTDSYTVSKYFYCGRTARGAEYIWPVSTYETKQVTAGMVANMVKKVRMIADSGVFYISDDGYAYPESILSVIGNVPIITRFNPPKNVWVTKDSTVVSTHANPSIVSRDPSGITILQSRSLDGENLVEQERDPHGFFLKLLGSSSQNLEGSNTILLAEIDGEEVYIDIVEDGDDIYVVEVTDENLKTVFVGNAEETTIVASIDTVDGDIAESDAFDYYTAVLHAGDIVTFIKRFEGADEVVHLYTDEHNVIHSVKASRLAEDFTDLEEIQQSSATKYYFRDVEAVKQPMKYLYDGKFVELADLVSVNEQALMFPNKESCAYIAPGVPTDAYRSARVSLGEPLSYNTVGGVNVLEYWYEIPEGAITPKYSASYDGVTYYAFTVSMSTSLGGVVGDKGTVTIWVKESDVSSVAPTVFEDCDVQAFPFYNTPIYSEPSKSSSTELFGFSTQNIEGYFTEFHLDKKVIQNGEHTFYRIANNSGIYSGKYIENGHVDVIEPITERIQLFHKKDTPMVNPILLSARPQVIAHSLYMVPSRKMTKNNYNGQHTYYEVTVAISATETHAMWIKDDDCIIVPVPSEAVSINNESVTVHTDAKAYLWDDTDAPVMHIFNEAKTFADFSVVSDNSGDRYICIEMARNELNQGDVHITIDDPTTSDVNESTEALRLFVPASDVTRNTQESDNLLIDVDDFDVYLGSQQQTVSFSKDDGSRLDLTDDERVALTRYLATRQGVAHIDALYRDASSGEVALYRISSDTTPAVYYACIKVNDASDVEMIQGRKVDALTNQDAVVVDSDDKTEGDILNVMWRFTTTDEDAEFYNCAVAVSLSNQDQTEEVVKLVEL